MRYHDIITELKINKADYISSDLLTIGFEFEILVNGLTMADAFNDVAKKLKTITSDKIVINNNKVKNKPTNVWMIEPDISVMGNDEHGVEIVSPPFSFNDGLSTMQKVFDLIQSAKWITNYTTGLHVNIAIRGKSKSDYDLLKMALFYDETYTLKQFDRVGNQYVDQLLPRLNRSLEFSPKDDVFSGERGVNAVIKDMRKFGEDVINTIPTLTSINMRENGVVEFRALGNAEYERRGKEILSYINKFANLVILSSDPTLNRNEYITKINRMFNAYKNGITSTILPSWNTYGTIIKRDLEYLGKSDRELRYFIQDVAMKVEWNIIDKPSDKQMRELRILMAKTKLSISNVIAYSSSENANAIKKLFGLINDGSGSIKENATAGATAAANIASVSKPLTGSFGSGFDPDGDYGIYAPSDRGEKKKKASNKPIVIRR